MFWGLSEEEVEGLDTELVLKALDRTIQNLESNTELDAVTKAEIYRNDGSKLSYFWQV